MGILQYNNAPNNAGFSPAQLFLSRNLRDRIPRKTRSYQPKSIPFEKYKEIIKLHLSQQSKQYYDRTAKDLFSLNVGDIVYFKINPKLKSWTRGIIDFQVNNRSFLISHQGKVYRRNRTHIKRNKFHLINVKSNKTTNKNNLPETVGLDHNTEIQNTSPKTDQSRLNDIRTKYGRISRPPSRLNYD